MKRTTLTLDEHLLRELKKKAAAEGRSLQDVANDLLRQALTVRKHAFTLKLQGWKTTEQAGVDIDRDKLFDLMNGR